MTKLWIAIALAGAAPAAAETVAVETRVITVSNIDVTTTTGQRQLNARIANAASELCGDASAVDLAGRNDVRECRAAVITDARRQRDAILAARSNGAIRLAAR